MCICDLQRCLQIDFDHAEWNLMVAIHSLQGLVERDALSLKHCTQSVADLPMHRFRGNEFGSASLLHESSTLWFTGQYSDDDRGIDYEFHGPSNTGTIVRVDGFPVYSNWLPSVAWS